MCAVRAKKSTPFVVGSVARASELNYAQANVFGWDIPNKNFYLDKIGEANRHIKME